MNCPSRTDEIPGGDGRNQNPPSLAAGLTTRQDLIGIANLRVQRHHQSDPDADRMEDVHSTEDSCPVASSSGKETPSLRDSERRKDTSKDHRSTDDMLPGWPDPGVPRQPCVGRVHPYCIRGWQIVRKFGRFVGPGFMISVAYIDPGNYSTDAAAGASTRFKLLFIVLMSNFIAIFLQSLAIRLGTITGLNLAEHCREHLPRWLNFVLYFLAEAAIIATDIAEVIGSAIALNLLFKIPLVAGCALTLADVLIILIFYSPKGSMKRLRAFEFFVMALVLGVVICFCVQLSLIKDTAVGEVFKGYLPSSAIIKGQGLYLSCGILGATVMPHSLYLGSGIVQARLRDFDTTAGLYATPSSTTLLDDKIIYRPSLAAIKSCLNYSIAELALSLVTFALFVNSAILIVAGASLSSTPGAESADLFGVHHLLSKSLAPAAGTIFALALLLSGTSAGIVCTIAGQMVSEGALNWTTAPWVRRLITRSISITPSIIVAGAVGKEGLSAALNGTQVALSVILPCVSAPLIYFTCRNRYMTVNDARSEEGEDSGEAVEGVKLRNHWAVSVLAVFVWIVLVIMNVSLLVLVFMGKA